MEHLPKRQQECIKEALEFEKRPWGRWLYYSVCLFFPPILGAVVLVLMQFHPPQMPEFDAKFIQAVIPYLVGLVFVEVLVSAAMKWPYYRFNDSVSSLSMGLINRILKMFVTGLGVLPYAYIYDNWSLVKFANATVFDHLVMFTFIDFAYYWFHRATHEFNLMWATHAPHHNSQEYNFSTALRQGAFQPWVSWCYYLPAGFFFPPSLYFIHHEFNIVYQFWIHTRTIPKLGPLELFLNTPSHHRVHHGRNPQYIDKNYGGTLIVWDRLFGTFEEEKDVPVYGITHELGTWNALYHQLHQFAEIWSAAKITPGLLNKARVFLDYGPGYNWRILEQPNLPSPPHPPVTFDTQVKYDAKTPNIFMNIYVSLHFVTILIEALKILDHYETAEFSFTKLALSAYIILGLFSLSLVFDTTKSVKRYRIWMAIEAFRLGLAAFRQSFEFSITNYFMIGAIVSLIWIFAFGKNRTPASSPSETIGHASPVPSKKQSKLKSK